MSTLKCPINALSFTWNPILSRPHRPHRPQYLSTLILSPPIPTSHALEEARHGLIRTPNLHLIEGCFVAVASICGTLNAALLRIVPRAGTTKDVFLFFALKDASREDGLGNGVFEGTGAALETVGALVRERDGEDVGALGADFVGRACQVLGIVRRGNPNGDDLQRSMVMCEKDAPMSGAQRESRLEIFINQCYLPYVFDTLESDQGARPDQIC